ncbi:MAG: dihydrofolate reductase family protein, partial [Firmicutes bacterium]|nr:dihydrofolate reductase family protein [Bacillota bacterium]
SLRTPPTARLLREPGQVVLLCAQDAAPERETTLRDSGALVVRVGGGGRPTAPQLIAELARLGARRLLVEGGPTLATALLEAGLVDEFWAFVAPTLLGSGRAALQSRPTVSMEEGWTLEDVRFSRVGADMLVIGRPVARALS